MTELKVGKLDSEVLQKLVIDEIEFHRPEVKTRSGIGEDCSIVEFGDYDCVISTDPITADVKNIGRLAIHISCNDIASNGVEPLGITLAVMLPVGTTEEDVRHIMMQASDAAKEAHVEIIGGHTEVTPAVRQPVIVSTAVGRGVAGASASAAEMRPGDLILMTKSAGLEGTGIIASNMEEEVSQFLTEEEHQVAKDMLSHVSVIREGMIAGSIGTHGMHDVTEGGILGAVWEMCQISGFGAELEEDAIPIAPVTRKIAEHYGINPLRLISSGCMLIVAPPSYAYRMVMEGHKTDVNLSFSIIGSVTDRTTDVKMLCEDGHSCIIDPPGPDELYRVIQ